MLMPSIFGENLLDDFFGDLNGAARNQMRYAAPSSSLMKTDIKETENDYEINIDLPGFKKEDVQAELKDGYLVITAKNESSMEDTSSKEYIRRERFYGTCSRSFYVGKEITQEEIRARFEDGILKVSVPKKQAKPAVEESKFIQIEG